jgi:hypothetical protein
MMIRRAAAFAFGVIAICGPIGAQPAKHRETQHRPIALQQLHAPGAVALSLPQSKIFDRKDNSLLFRNGPVMAWSDGGRLASENALAETGMVSLDFFPSGLPPNSFGAVQPRRGSAATPRSADMIADPKDSPVMESQANPVYYGGEIGFMYGRWSGKGSGDYLDSYILGQVGNDKFQISAGAEYEQWSGHAGRSRSFIAR